MSSRDLIFGLAGVVSAAAGIIAAMFGLIQISLSALFVLGLLLLTLNLLQRRQIAKLQERNLALVALMKDQKKLELSRIRDIEDWKKVLNLLNAQQISMERLRNEMKDLSLTRNSNKLDSQDSI